MVLRAVGLICWLTRHMKERVWSVQSQQINNKNKNDDVSLLLHLSSGQIVIKIVCVQQTACLWNTILFFFFVLFFNCTGQIISFICERKQTQSLWKQLTNLALVMLTYEMGSSQSLWMQCNGVVGLSPGALPVFSAGLESCLCYQFWPTCWRRRPQGGMGSVQLLDSTFLYLSFWYFDHVLLHPLKWGKENYHVCGADLLWSDRRNTIIAQWLLHKLFRSPLPSKNPHCSLLP